MATRHVTGKRFWLKLPRAREVIQHKERWAWVRDGARAIIATTPPGGRFLILKGGFPKFQDLGKVCFRELSPFAFDTIELRAMFEYLGLYAERYEWHLQQGLQLLYERELRKLSSNVPRADDTPATDDSPEVEAVRDGSLRRVR